MLKKSLLKIKLLVLALFLGVFALPPASAIVNGKEVIGSDFVVTLLPNGKNGEGFCTGVYFSERVIVTAAHCVIKNQGKAPELRFPIDNFYVSQPGINWKSKESKINSVRVLKIWTEPDYDNRWNPDMNQRETQINDVAFLFLEKPLESRYINRAANSAEIDEFKKGIGSAFHLGYGCVGGKDSNSLIYDGLPRRLDGISGTSRSYPHFILKDRFLVVDYPVGTSLCPGDSGSPLLLQKGDQVLYLGTIFAGGGWLEATANTAAQGAEASVTVFWPFQNTLNSEYSKFIAEEKIKIELLELKAKQEVEIEAQKLRDREAAVLANTHYKDTSGCHSVGIQAELQILEQGAWKSLVSAKGWDKDSACPATHPVRPWTIAEVEFDSSLRWHFWSAGQFDVFGNPFQSLLSTKDKLAQEAEAKAAAELKAKQEAEAKAAAELKAKQEAEAKAAAELKAKQEAEAKAAADKAAGEKIISDAKAEAARILAAAKVASSKKKITITCVKGKLTKKVTAVKPVCPKGYKKK